MNKEQINDILALAARQHSLFSFGQASSRGITPDELEGAVRRGWLYRPRRGVFGLAGAPYSDRQPLMAALLAAGERSVASHASAAVVHGFAGIVAPTVELTTPEPLHPRLSGVRTHRSTTLKRADVQVRDGLRVTSPIRTLIDLAPRLGTHLLGEVLDEGSIARLWTPGQVAARYQQLTTRQRPAELGQLLELRLDEGSLRSRLEQRVCRVLRPAVEPFEVNHVEVLEGVAIEMDLAWRADKIDGEVDGLWPRAASRTKFLRQCRRENILAAHGWRIVHFTHEMDDETIIAQVAPLLGRRKAVNS